MKLFSPSNPSGKSSHFRDAAGFSNPGGLAVVIELVAIGLTELPNSGWALAHPSHPLAASLTCD